MKTVVALVTAVALTTLMAACSSTPKVANQPMPESGFLPNYSALVSAPMSDADARMWTYRKPGVDAGQYTAVILDPIFLKQKVSKDVSAETIQKTRDALKAAMVKAVQNRGNIKIVTQPGPGVARIKVGITGAQSSADGLKPWNFTPIGLAVNAAAYAGDVNEKTPALVVESKITDSQTDELIGDGLVVVEGESFRTDSGSLESFIALAQKVVTIAMEGSASPELTK
jgi:hypothetical protein